MAEFVLTDPYVSIGAVDLSDHCRQVTIKGTRANVEQTAAGDAGVKRAPALYDWTMDFVFNQDFAAGNVDATLYTAWTGTGTAIIVRADSGAVGATNPEWTGTGLLPEYTPVSGSIGDNAEISASFVGQNGSALARATA